jgi:hypothetical protein
MTTPTDWTLGVTYYEPGTPWVLDWVVTSAPTHGFRCPSTRKLIARAVADSGLKVCFIPDLGAYGYAFFESHHLLYIVNLEGAPADSTPAANGAWLLREIGQRRTW